MNRQPAPVVTAACTLVRVFDATFAEVNVRMHGGAREPLYVPAAVGVPARLLFTLDYASSALHEAAHWCLAGAHRRTLVDFGYAYVPAALRSPADQDAFERAEVRTQALEWRLSIAARVPFHLSLDSLGRDRVPFRARVVAEVQRRLGTRWPPRIDRLALALAAATGGNPCPLWGDFEQGIDDV